jgi:3-dehydroquinate dehydratase type I
LAGAKPKICASIVAADSEAIQKVEPIIDLYEVRIDLIGKGWGETARRLKKPWIACNRRTEEGGKWRGGERERVRELLVAIELGAAIIDIELATPNLGRIVREMRGKAECLISYHDINGTPAPGEMKGLVRDQLNAGADICKVVTTARSFADNQAVLQLITDFPKEKVVSFAMGAAGQISRVLCPLVGGYFTYASIAEGKEAAEGQITVAELRNIYGMLGKD